MDVPLVLNDIGIRNGFEGYSRKSSIFHYLVDVVGLFGFYAVSIMWNFGGRMIDKQSSCAL